MKKIILNQGKQAIVNEGDYYELSKHHWSYKKEDQSGNEGVYCYSIGKWLHNFLTNCPKNKVVHHINGNRLDNRRENLVVLTRSQFESTKSSLKSNRHGIKGVSWNRRKRKWHVKISVNNRQIYLGSFDNAVVAAMKYNEAALKYHGEYAYLNDLENIDLKSIYKKLRINEQIAASKNPRWGVCRSKKERS